MTFFVLSLGVLTAFWHWNAGTVYWLRGFGNTKLSFPRSFEPQVERWWQWTPRMGNDDHQDAVILQGRHQGSALDHSTSALMVTTEALCFADPISTQDRPCINPEMT